MPLRLRNRDRHIGYHDRDVCDRARPRRSTYGLTDAELRAHFADLRARGWPAGEILAVLDVDPREVAA